MRFFRPCFLAKRIYPEALFRIKTEEKLLCLTFDDGPDPLSTPELIDILWKYDVRALFFLSGRNAEKHPELVERISEEGHLTGNHTYSHLNGWRYSVNDYIQDIEKASHSVPGLLFRPPYGRLRLKQFNELKKKYRIVFWDIMPYDFDSGLPWERSLNILTSRLRPGSVIALHDSPASTCNKFLGNFLAEATDRGYRFVLPA